MKILSYFKAFHDSLCDHPKKQVYASGLWQFTLRFDVQMIWFALKRYFFNAFRLGSEVSPRAPVHVDLAAPSGGLNASEEASVSTK